MTMSSRLGAARPFDVIDDAVAAIVADLDRRGHGCWTVVHADDGPRLVPSDETVATASADPSVLVASRLIATLLAARTQVSILQDRVTRAERESSTDALTALPNVRGWWSALAREASRCDRQHLTALIAVIDVDDLKSVNDTLGHLAGDALLRRVADALTGALRPVDIVARLGGDEFGVLTVDFESAPERLVARLGHALTRADARASIGVAVYQAGGFIEDTFDRADQHMYATKRVRQSSRS